MIYKYDGCGFKCPIPLIKVRLLLKNILATDQCLITLDDSGSIKDIPRYLQKKGYVFIIKKLTNNTIQIKINYGFSIDTETGSLK
jgi:TusA-related sulfurtransferase